MFVLEFAVKRLALLAVLMTLGCSAAKVRKEGLRTEEERHRREPSVAARGPMTIGNTEASRRCAELWPLIKKAALEAGVEPALLVGLVRTESNFRNDVRSSAGAMGLTQVLGSTAKAKRCGDIRDAYENLLCGARILASFLEYYNGDVILGLSGYNAGHLAPEGARANERLPANIQYVENVLWARARFLFKGCDF